jgi:LPS-assembly protein
MRKAIQIFLLCLLVPLLICPDLTAESLHGAENLTTPPKDGSGWRLRADYFSYDERQDIYTASGRVYLQADDRQITADRIHLDAYTREAVLEGDVRIEMGQDWLEGDRAYLDLDQKTGVVEGGRGFLSAGNFHFSGAVIEKLGPQTYHMEDGAFTTCDGDKPSWHIRTSDLKVTVEGYGFAKHARFHAGRTPVLYTPWLAFPAKTKRQTGLLMPRLALGDLLGYDVDLPFFWASSRSTDATIYSHYMSKRGLMMGGEFRYAASNESFGELRFDYLDDQENTATLRNKGFRQVSPGFDGEYFDRWWWRSKQNLALPLEIRGKVDLDFVSDPDYLNEFQTGYSSWKQSDRIFRKSFDRGLKNDETITTRESTLLLNKFWAAQSVNLELHYFQNLNTIENNYQLQQLPLVTYSASRQLLLGGPFFWQANGQYINYWREEGTRGNRLNLEPTLSLPLRGGPYLQLEPFVGFLETAYLIEDYDEPAGSQVEEKTFQNRALLETGITASTDLVRIFSMGGTTWTKTKHTMRPQIVYEYRPKVNQSKLPNFDSLDRINSRNRLTYSLTNFFTSRLDPEPGKVEYQDFVRLEFSQFYDFSQPEGGVDDPSTSADRPFSDLFVQLDLTPREYVNLTYKSAYSLYDGEFKNHSLVSSFWDSRGDRMEVDYSRALGQGGQTAVDEIDAKVLLNLWDGVSFKLRSNYSFSENENIKSEFNLTIQRQCWGISAGYIDEPDNRRVVVGINLYGVGDLRAGQFSF